MNALGRPSDWSPLGLSADPTPGDLGELQAATDLLGKIADATNVIETVLTQILGTAGSGNFQGLTAQALSGQISQRFIHFMRDADHAFSTAHSAMVTYISVLPGIQATADDALAKAKASGLTTDDPQIQAWAAQATQAGTDATNASNTAGDAINSVSNGASPVSGWEAFWEIFSWIAIILIIPAIVFGGVWAIVAFAVNLTLFAKAAVDFAEGKISAGEFLLAFLGILGPTTKGLDLAELLPAIGKAIGGAVRDGFGAVSGTLTGLIDLARGFSFSKFFTLDTLIALGQWGVRSGLLIFQGLKDLPTILADGTLATGRFLGEFLAKAGAGIVQDVRSGAWVSLVLPLDRGEINAVGFAGAFRLGILERGFGFSHDPVLALRMVAADGLHGYTSSAPTWSLSSDQFFRADPAHGGLLTPHAPSTVFGMDPHGTLYTGTVFAPVNVSGHISGEPFLNALHGGHFGTAPLDTSVFRTSLDNLSVGSSVSSVSSHDMNGLLRGIDLGHTSTPSLSGSAFGSVHTSLDSTGLTLAARGAQSHGASVLDLRNPTELSAVFNGEAVVAHLDDFSLVIHNIDHPAVVDASGAAFGRPIDVSGAAALSRPVSPTPTDSILSAVHADHASVPGEAGMPSVLGLPESRVAVPWSPAPSEAAYQEANRLLADTHAMPSIAQLDERSVYWTHRLQNLELGQLHREAVEQGRFPGLRDNPADAPKAGGDEGYGRIVAIRLVHDDPPRTVPAPAETSHAADAGLPDIAPIAKNDAEYGRIVALHLVDDSGLRISAGPGSGHGGVGDGHGGGGAGDSGTPFSSGGHVINRGRDTQTMLETPGSAPKTVVPAPTRVKPADKAPEFPGVGQRLGSGEGTAAHTETTTATAAVAQTETTTVSATGTQAKTTAIAPTESAAASHSAPPDATPIRSEATPAINAAPPGSKPPAIATTPPTKVAQPASRPPATATTPPTKVAQPASRPPATATTPPTKVAPPAAKPPATTTAPPTKVAPPATATTSWTKVAPPASKPPAAKPPASAAPIAAPRQPAPTLADAVFHYQDKHGVPPTTTSGPTLVLRDLNYLYQDRHGVPPPPPTADATLVLREPDLNFLYQDRHGVPPPEPTVDGTLVLRPERGPSLADFLYQDRHGVAPPPPPPTLVLDEAVRTAHRDARLNLLWRDFVEQNRRVFPGPGTHTGVPAWSAVNEYLNSHVQAVSEQAAKFFSFPGHPAAQAAFVNYYATLASQHAWRAILESLAIHIPAPPSPRPMPETARPPDALDMPTAPPAPTPSAGRPVWLPASTDGVLHAQAVEAVPRAVGWTTFIAHSEAGRIVSGDSAIAGGAVAERLHLPHADGRGVVMLVCNAAAKPAGGGPSIAQDVHLAADSATPVLAPTGEAMLSDGDVLSGTWTVDANLQTVPDPNGDWVLWEGGVAHALGTPSLTEALARLGIDVTPGGPAPDAPVAFYHQITPEQTATANRMRYGTIAAHENAQGFVDFYTALLDVTGHRLMDEHNVPHTAATLHRLLLAELEEDLGSPISHYAGLFAPNTDVEQFLRDLRDPAFWDRQASLVLPHVAADSFGLELGVLGARGFAEAVGDINGPRRGDANGDPLLLLDVGDRFVGLEPQPVPAGTQVVRELRPRFQPGQGTAWTRALTQAEHGLVDQVGRGAPLPPGIQEQGIRHGGRAIVQHLADRYTDQTPAELQAAATALTDRIRQDLELWQSPIGDALRQDLDTLDRVTQHLQQVEQQVLDRVGAIGQTMLGDFTRPAPLQDALAVEHAAELSAFAEAAPGLRAARAANSPQNSALIGDLNQLYNDAVLARMHAINQVEHRAAADAMRTVGPPPIGIPTAMEWWNKSVATRQRTAIRDVQDQAAAAGDQAFANAVVQGLQAPHIAQAIEDLALGRIQEDRAYQAETWIPAAQQHGIAQRDAFLAPHRQRAYDSAASAAEWQIRQNNAVDALLADDPPRFLPPGFGEAAPAPAPAPAGTAAGGAQPVRTMHPMGRGGRFIRFDDVRLSDHRSVVDMVVRLLPNPTPELERATRQAVQDFLDEHGAQTFAQRLLEGGLDLEVRDGALTDAVHLELALGDLTLAHHLRALATETTPIGLAVGRKQHFPVEADHESTAGNRKTASSARSIGVGGNVAWGFGGPSHIHGLRFGLSLTGKSTRTYGGGSDAVSATKRLFPLTGESSYFDIPGAALSVQTRQAAAAGLAANSENINVRLAFPQELAPVRPDAGAASALPSAPLTEPGSVRLGVDRVQLAAEANPNGPLHQAADRVAALQHEFFNLIESVGGLDQIRTQVAAALQGNAAHLDAGLAEGVEFALGEGSFLRMFGDISGPGWTTPMFMTGKQDPGMRLKVTGRLRNAQAVSVGPVPLKEESQRFVNLAQEEGHSAELSVSAPNFRYGYTINEHGGIGVESTITAAASAGRTMAANSGSGHISGLVYNGDSVLYRTEFAVDADVIRPNTRRGGAERISTDVVVFLRIPISQRERFEAAMRAAVDQTLASQVPKVDHDPAPIDPNADAAKVATEIRERGQERHPPLHLAAGRGTGFATISHLAGAERVLPRLEELVMAAGAPMAWSRAWDEMELAHLRTQLASRFTREGLVNWGSALFQEGGVRMELYRPGTEGTEIITVTVSGHLVSAAQPPAVGTSAAAASAHPVPKARGRVHSTKLEIMPSTFAGAGGGDTIGASLGIGFDLGGIGNPEHAGLLASISPGVHLGASRAATKGTKVQASGFLLEAILYDGPARYFDYDVRFDMNVSVRHVEGTTGMGWPQTLGRRIVPGGGRRPQAVRPPQNTSLGRANQAGGTLPGSTRFVLVEQLAPTARPAAAQLARAGTIQFDRTGVQPAGRTVTIPDVTRHFQGNGHTPLTMDDQVMEVLGGSRLGDELAGMLDDLGIRATTYGNLPWVLTSSETLASSMVRGPSVLYHQIVEGGQFNDRVADITITGFPHNDRSDPKQPIDMFQMHVAEGSAAVGWSKTVKTTKSAKISLLPLKINDSKTGHGTINTGIGLPDLSYSKTTAITQSENLTATTGRLTQGTRPYLEHTADMVWQISVTVRDRNMFRVTPARSAHTSVRVADGLTFLRLANPVTDMRAAVHTAPPPRTPRVLRSDRNPPAGTQLPAGTHRVIPTLPAAPGSNVRVPIVPLIPATAASERLIPQTAAAGATDVTGEGNSLLDAVRRLLADNAPNLLDSYWTVQEGPPAVAGAPAVGGAAPRLRQVPQKLSNLLNPASLEALLDVLLGPGLVLHTIRSGPLYNERVQIVLRATRDPRGTGYTFLEHVNSANVSRYWFRLNSEDAGNKGTTYGSGWSHGTATSVSGVPQPTHLAGGGARPNTEATSSASRGSAVTVTDAVRDTFFTAGPADRYVGEIELSATLTRTLIPSLPTNIALLSLPRRALGWWQQVGVHTIEHPTVRVPMLERVLVPTELLHDDRIPQPPLPPAAPAYGAAPPLGTFAVTEVDAGRTAVELGQAPFALRREDLLAHDAIAFGFDHAKLRILLEQALPRLGGNIAPLSGQSSSVVSRMLEAGTRSQDALHYALSYGMFTRQLEHLLGPDGMTMPTLVREGATFTDNVGRLTVRVELANPRVRGHIDGWAESVDYGFREFNTSSGISYGRSLGVGGDPAVSERAESTDRDPKPYDSRAKTTGEGVSLSFGRTRGDEGSGVLKTMPRSRAASRQAPWLRADVDAIVHLTLHARNERDLLTGTSGEVTVSFHMSHALEVGLSPELALELGLVHPQGVPVPSGVFVPALSPRGPVHGVPNDTRDSLTAAFAMPPTPNVFAIHARVDAAGHFIVGDQALTADQFAQQVLTRYDLTPQHTLVLVTSRADHPTALPGQSPVPAQASAAEALALATGLPVLATGHDVFITLDGSALAGDIARLRNESPHLSDFQSGSWTLLSPIDQQPAVNRDVLSFDLEQALAACGLALGARPKLVPSAGQIVRR